MRKTVDQEEWDEILHQEGLHEARSIQVIKLVDRPEFDVAIGVVICLNALVMGIECDLKTGPVQHWPIWIILDNAFCLVWLGEMVLKLYYLHLKYFHLAWNCLDFFLVLLSVNDAWIMPAVGLAEDMESLGVIRMVRMLRILRLLRLLRLMKMFKNLWLIVSGFLESLSTLYWVLLLMGLVVYIFAVLLRSTINCDIEYVEWAECNIMFKSVPWTMYTLFQVITLESWSMAIGRPLMAVQPLFFLVILCFLFLTTFGILNIIVGVIVENTLNAAKQNQELQEKRMQKQMRAELETLKVVFEEADVDGSGTVELEEFVDILKVSSVSDTLKRMEIPLEEPGVLFELLDAEGEGSISFTSFTRGIQKVKGPPTGLDMKTMQVSVSGIARRLNRIEKTLSTLTENQEKMQEVLLQQMKSAPPPPSLPPAATQSSYNGDKLRATADQQQFRVINSRKNVPTVPYLTGDPGEISAMTTDLPGRTTESWPTYDPQGQWKVDSRSSAHYRRKH